MTRREKCSMARTAFSVSRDLELVTQDGLTKRMGIVREGWLRATVKELIDNALDACEEAGIDPEIKITIAGSVLTVADNGPGVAPETVERLCTLAERTSSREAYAAPDRGAQGNALQTIMLLGFGFGREVSGITIESRGVNHQIQLRVNRLARTDRAGARGRRRCRPAQARSVSIAWPEPIDPDQISSGIWSRSTRWLNPHAEFRLIIDGRNPSGRQQPRSANGRPACRSRRTGTRRNALPIACCWRSARTAGRTITQFLGKFHGLSDRSRRSRVAAEARLSYMLLAALLDSTGTRVDPDRAQALLEAMQAPAARPSTPCSAASARKPSSTGPLI